MENQTLNFLLNDKLDEVTVRSLESFELLLDTADYVPPKFLKKMNKDAFKIYRKQRWRIKRVFRKSFVELAYEPPSELPPEDEQPLADEPSELPPESDPLAAEPPEDNDVLVEK